MISSFTYSSKIYVAGHRGLTGSAIVRTLRTKGYDNIVVRSSKDLDLRDRAAVREFFQSQKPEFVFFAAARTGGIYANKSYPAQFMHDNLAMGINVLDESYQSGVKKLLFFGSACAYPKVCPQPIKEEYMLTGYLDPSTEPYGLSKLVSMKMCESYNRQYSTNFISVVPTNLYGPGDNFDLKNSHVMAALIRKFHEGKVRNSEFVEVWGTGTPTREFLYVDDLADACIYLMANYNESDPINLGVGEDIRIDKLAELMAQVVGYKGKIKYNTDMPDGTPRRQLDVSKLNRIGWKPQVKLIDGIKKTYEWFVDNLETNTNKR